MFCFAVGSDSRFKSFKALMATTVSSQIWCSANSKAECQSSAANDDHQHQDEDPEDIELDLGSAYWNEALQQLRWSCVNCDRSVFDYEWGLQKLQRGAKLDQRIKEAAVDVSNFGIMDRKLYMAWTGQTFVKPGVMPPPLPCLHDIATWPMDDVLVYDHPKWQLFVGSLVCPMRFDQLGVKPDIVIAMNGDDRSIPYEPCDWYEYLANCGGPFGTAHLRYGGWDQTHANDFDAEQRSNEFKSIWRRLISDFRQIVLCWHREDDEFSEGQRQSAKGKMTPGKSGGKGKGKAISKGYQFSHHIQSLFKGAVGKDKGFSDVGKTRLGKVATDIDARQSASGLKVAEESLPGQLDRALQRLELMKLGRNFWKRGGKRRPIRVLVHCHGGIKRTCAAFCWSWHLPRCLWNKPLPSGSRPEPTMLHSSIVSI